MVPAPGQKCFTSQATGTHASGFGGRIVLAIVCWGQGHRSPSHSSKGIAWRTSCCERNVCVCGPPPGKLRALLGGRWLYFVFRRIFRKRFIYCLNPTPGHICGRPKSELTLNAHQTWCLSPSFLFSILFPPCSVSVAPKMERPNLPNLRSAAILASKPLARLPHHCFALVWSWTSRILELSTIPVCSSCVRSMLQSGGLVFPGRVKHRFRTPLYFYA